MANPDDSDGEGKKWLLERILGRSGVPIPTSALGRIRRTATTAIRAGADQLLGRLASGEGFDPKAIERLVLSLGELKGIAMKFGQILSYVDVPLLTPQARELLALLQRQSQATPFTKIETIVRAELGEPAVMLLATMDRAPVATASVGQVHRAKLPDGTPVAVKVLHPGVEEAIRADFKTAQVGKAMAGLIAPGVEVKEVIAEARERFLEECDYTLERKRQSRFAEIYRGHPSIGIPRVLEEFCSRRVLTTQWRDGLRLEDFARTATQDARDRAGEALYEFYIGTLYRHGLFNADPHPGNLLFGDDGSVVILDHGCVREFDRGTVACVARLSKAVREDRREGIMAALRGLEAKPPEDDKAFEATRRLLRGFFQPTLESGPRPMRGDVTFEARQLVADKRAVLKIRLPGRLLFLFRIRFGLYSVLARIGAVRDWRALEERFTLEVLASAGEAAGR
jgi:predicted unusual protein kinase regulating ubiquinone biosynthesis (AarF/ABC1/UbiB family)